MGKKDKKKNESEKTPLIVPPLSSEYYALYPGPLIWFFIFLGVLLLLLIFALVYAAHGGRIQTDFDQYLLGMQKHLRRINPSHKLNDWNDRTEPCVATIYLIRHAEKGHVWRELSEIGHERAKFLPSIFCDSKGGGGSCRFGPSPAQIYARAPVWPNYVLRSIQTVTPLAKHLNLSVNSRFSKANQGALVAKALGQIANMELCDKSILICWKHSLMHGIMSQLGCDQSFIGSECIPFFWKHDDFDSVGHLVYDFQINSTGKDRPTRWAVKLELQAQKFSS